MQKIGIIGLGHMGKAIVQAFKKNGLDKKILGFHYLEKKALFLENELNIQVTAKIEEFINQVEVIFLAVRLEQIDEVIGKIDHFNLVNKMIVSIVSGLTISNLKLKFKQEVLVIRALPNLNAAFGLSATGVAYDLKLNASQKNMIHAYLSYFGKVYEISEAQFSAFTVVAGCTPAYFFKLIDAIYQSGVKNGLESEIALNVAIQSGYGSLVTTLNSQLTPKQLVEVVCVPGGITIKGINYLDEQKFEEKINQAIEKSIAKDLQDK